MKNCIVQNSINLTLEEEKLLNNYLEEYNELYEKIIILTPNEFIRTMIKRVEITMKEKFNGFSQNSRSKVENLIIEKIYCRDYKFALFAKKHIIKRNKDEMNFYYFNKKIIPHCENDKKNNFYIHSCGERFQTYRYKPVINSSLLKVKKKYINSKDPEFLLYCIECDMIYKSDLIKFKCNSSNENFYSQIIDENKSKNNNNLATWKNYHCNIIINDAMKCQKCNENLYYLEEKNKLWCKKCNIELNPKEIKWKCIKCKSTFIAEVKIFNPLEYKNIKICVKETIFNKKKAKPEYLGCRCKIDFKKIDFFHKNSCKGKLFLGELNGKKVVVCDKCQSLGIFNNYLWTCPKCLKRFKISENSEKKDENEKKEEIKEEEKKEKEKEKDDTPIKTPMKRFFFYSNSNWNIKGNKNNDIYKSPRLKYKLLLNKKNESTEKEKETKSDIKNIHYIRRNNSAIRFNVRKEIPSRLPSPSKIIKEVKNNNNIKLDNLNIDLNNNLNENYSAKKLDRCESKISKNEKMCSSKNSPKRKKLISNLDLTEIKNLNNIFNKYFSGSPNKITDIKNNNNNDYSNEKRFKNKNYILTDANLEEKVKINYKYKKNFIPNYNKKISQISQKNNIENKIGRKRSNSGYNSIKINIDNPAQYNKQIIRNNAITNAKIPINKNIVNHKVNKKREESTSCDSNEKNNNNSHNRSQSKKKESSNNIKNKKVIPGKFNINDYEIKKQIGQGSFGQIFLVEDKEKNKYALKKIIASSSNDIESIKKEYQILLDIQNTIQGVSVVNIFGLKNYKLDLTTHVLYVLMELASTDWEKEVLTRKVKKNYYSEKELMEILSCLLKSLSILQKQNISHRDIKPQNILVFNDNNNISKKIYKLADFGEAKELLKGDKTTNKQTLRGTELYMSPILFYALRGRKPIKYVQHNTYKSDVFSFGLCALFAATLCFESLYDVRELKSNVSLRVVIQKYLKFRYSHEVISLITKMLDVNETTRMDFIELENELNKLGY